MNNEKFKRIDLEKASKIPGIQGRYDIYKNYYWLIDENGNGLNYNGYSVQANKNKELCEVLLKSKNHPSTDIKFYETIFIEYDESNYYE